MENGRRLVFIDYLYKSVSAGKGRDLDAPRKVRETRYVPLPRNNCVTSPPMAPALEKVIYAG